MLVFILIYSSKKWKICTSLQIILYNNSLVFHLLMFKISKTFSPSANETHTVRTWIPITQWPSSMSDFFSNFFFCPRIRNKKGSQEAIKLIMWQEFYFFEGKNNQKRKKKEPSQSTRCAVIWGMRVDHLITFTSGHVTV